VIAINTTEAIGDDSGHSGGCQRCQVVGNGSRLCQLCGGGGRGVLGGLAGYVNSRQQDR